MFEDPVSELPEGAAWLGNWLPFVQEVASPRLSTVSSDQEAAENRKPGGGSGLYVVVAENYGKVLEPVERLSSRLFWLAIYATLFFVVVALLMWLMVLRMLRESNNRLIRSFTGGDSTIRGTSDST